MGEEGREGKGRKGAADSLIYRTEPKKINRYAEK